MVRTFFGLTGLLALSLGGLSMAAGCGSSGGGGGASAGSGGTGGGGGSGNPCADYFNATIANAKKCDTGPVPPSSEISRIASVAAQSCENALNLPGNKTTSSNIEACANAISSLACRTLQAPAACEFPLGTKANGAACNESSQCQSGDCLLSSSSSGCGTCMASIPDGKPCGTGPGLCAEGSTCDLSPVTFKGTCAKMVTVGKGATCDGSAKQCGGGLYCDTTTKKCAMTLGSGAKCASSYDCTWPLVCTGSLTATTCQSPVKSGAKCNFDTDCASGLGCSTTKKTCGAVKWVNGSQSCGDLTRCLVGTCSTSGACPKVLKEGEACLSSNTETCDDGLTCIAGKCQIANSVTCK